jgi:VanZ family protein
MLKKVILAIVWALFISLLSAFPGNKIPKFDLVGIDKLVHFIFYAIFAFLILNILNDRQKNKITMSAVAFFTVTAYGFLIELAQGHFFSQRSFDWADALANGIGAFFGVLIFWYVVKKDFFKFFLS